MSQSSQVSRYFRSYEYINNEYLPFIYQTSKDKPLILKIMKFEDGIHSQWMNKILEQLDIMLCKYQKVFVYRVDFHVEQPSDNNLIMTKLNKSLLPKVKKLYGNILAYAWARERGTSKKQHYHAVYILNGHKIHYPSQLSKLITEVWDKSLSGFTYIVKNCFYNLRRGKKNYFKKVMVVIYRLSYLAKNYSKGKKPKQVKNFQSSRLTWAN